MVTLTENLDYFAFMLAIMGTAAAGLYMWLKLNWLPKVEVVLVAGATVLMFTTVIMRMQKTGSLPVNSVYEFILAFVLVMLVIALIAIWKIKLPGLNLFILLVATVLLGVSFGISDSVTPLMPALQSNWRVVHVLTAIASYSSFAVAFGLGISYLVVVPKKIPEGGLPAEKVEKGEFIEGLMYNSVVVGFIFLTLLLVTGSIWAEDAWGAWWSWDPKETWALITWIIYAIYLHLHGKKEWRGHKGCYLSIIGFACVLFTLLGVTFLMGGLHSY